MLQRCEALNQVYQLILIFFRWLSHREFLQTFLFNYEFYLKIRDEEPTLFSPHEKRILDNRQIKEGAVHMLDQLDVISRGLNVMQSDSSHLGDAMNTWLTLSSSSVLTDELKIEINARMESAITPAHVFAKMVMNKDGLDLGIAQKQDAMDFVEGVDKRLSGILAAFEVEDTTVFPPAAFKHCVKDVLEPIKYWQYISANTELEPLKLFCDLAIRVLTCPPSSAGEVKLVFILHQLFTTTLIV